jgi:hypothetical protein
MVPTPVCVIMPMMVPTMAQAMPTVSADLALSASESRQIASVVRPPRVTAAIRTNPPTTLAIGMISRPVRDTAATTSASPNQKM